MTEHSPPASPPYSPRRSSSRAAFKCSCSQRSLRSPNDRFPVKLVVFDFDETLTLITYIIEEGDTPEMQREIVKTNFQSPWVKGSRIANLKSMLSELRFSRAGSRRAVTVLTKNNAGASSVLTLLYAADLLECFDAIWALPSQAEFSGIYRHGEEWLPITLSLQDVAHKADLLTLVAQRPADFLPQMQEKPDEWTNLADLVLEGIVLVDDQRANFQSPSGEQVLRFCKVARYDAFYRNLGFVKNMGGIGAHCVEDFRTLQMFVEAPSMYKETFKLHCVQRRFPDYGVRRPVEVVLFDFDETLTLATFMPSLSFFSHVDWDPGELQGTDWSAEELVLYSFESPFLDGCRLALLKAMLQDIAKRHILAVLSKNESGAAAVLNLLKLAGLAEYFSAIWTTPFRSLVPCGVYRASPGQWEVFEPPLMDVQDHQTEVLYDIVDHTDKWFPQIGLKQDRFVRLQPLSPESVILIDDERENLQSPLGKQALRYCKVARYDEVYRNCGPLNQLGGIGAHSEEDFETLKAFIAEPWAFQEPSFEKEQGEEGAVAERLDASRMSSRSEELRKLPRSRLSRSNSSPSLRDAPRLPGMSRSQSFCSSPRLDIADPDCHTPEFSLTGID